MTAVACLLCACTLALSAGSLATAAPLLLARDASVAVLCPGVVKASYGTFSRLKVSAVTCTYARAFVRITGGVPVGWGCTTRRVGTGTMSSCRNGAKAISYRFAT
jgi:hypothetical protein